MGKTRDVLTVVMVTLLVTAGGSGPARAQNFSAAINSSEFFRVEAEGGQTRRGRLVVRGYLYNRSPYQIARVRLGVEALDASGTATGAPTAGWVNGEIPSNDRRYFEVPVTQPGTTYRVTVLSYDVRTLDGGNVN